MSEKKRRRRKIPSPGPMLAPGLQQIQIPGKHANLWRRIEKAERAVAAVMIACEHAVDYVASVKQGFIEMVKREESEEATIVERALKEKEKV